jgi:hypothetical protein
LLKLPACILSPDDYDMIVCYVIEAAMFVSRDINTGLDVNFLNHLSVGQV